MDNVQLRDKLLTRWGALKSERASWMPHWREISTYLLPRSGRYLTSDRNKGERRHNSIYDSTGTRALDVLAAGMMAGMTSPARPWFRLTTADPDMAKQGAVKAWLADTTQLMRDVFQRSNTYRALHTMYAELGAFGTAASIVSEDFSTIIRHTPQTAGEYAIATDWAGNVVTLYREFEQQVSEIVGEFGLANVSQSVRSLYERGSLDAWVPIVHAIEPRADRDAGKRDSRHMPWRSVYFEPGAREGQFLREGGFEHFPALVPRWSVTGGDIYGESPAMKALGDVKQLQQEQLRKSQGIDYMTRPPLQMPTHLKNAEGSSLPGGVAYVDAAAPQGGIRTQFEVRLDLNHLLLDIQDVRQRIREAFYADLFLMLAGQPRDTRMTATEVAERHEEKMLMLGPVLERLHNEMLDPLVETTFARMMRAGVLPPPPPELQGADLNIEYVSMLAQAQQAVSTNSVDRFVLSLGQLAQIKPDVLDKLDADQWADTYSDALGIDPSLIVPSEKAALVRQARAKAQAQAQQAEQAPQAAQAAKALSQTDTQGLTDVMSMFTGYSS